MTGMAAWRPCPERTAWTDGAAGEPAARIRPATHAAGTDAPARTAGSRVRRGRSWGDAAWGRSRVPGVPAGIPAGGLRRLRDRPPGGRTPAGGRRNRRAGRSPGGAERRNVRRRAEAHNRPGPGRRGAKGSYRGETHGRPDGSRRNAGRNRPDASRRNAGRNRPDASRRNGDRNRPDASLRDEPQNRPDSMRLLSASRTRPGPRESARDEDPRNLHLPGDDRHDAARPAADPSATPVAARPRFVAIVADSRPIRSSRGAVHPALVHPALVHSGLIHPAATPHPVPMAVRPRVGASCRLAFARRKVRPGGCFDDLARVDELALCATGRG
jgi:hypothetical protein